MKIEIINSYIISVYLNEEFVGYIKNYRLQRNQRYRFNKTKNINNCLIFNSSYNCGIICTKLNVFKDEIYNKSYTFKCTKITDQEIRKSKLSVLKIIKIKDGIFKNKNI